MTALFSWVNRVDGAALLAGDQSAGLPVSNLADRIVQKVYRSGTSTSTYFEIDFGAAYSIQLLGLFGCTLASTDTVRHRLSAVSAGAGELLDTGAVACGVNDLYGTHCHRLDAAVSARYWRCDFVGTSRTAEGYVDLGRAWAGEIFEPKINYGYGWTEGFVDTADITRARHSGVAFVSEGAAYRTINVKFEWMASAEKQTAMAIDKMVGKRAQIVFAPDTSDLTTALVARMSEIPSFAQPTPAAPACFSKEYKIDQEL